MKVIKHGNVNTNINCLRCGAELEYESKDILYDTYYQTSQCFSGYVICPDCGARIYINASYTVQLLPYYPRDGAVPCRFDPDWGKFTCSDISSTETTGGVL